MHLTPTEQRIMAVLADGYAHPAQALQLCLYTETQLGPHLTSLRRKLRLHGQGVHTENLGSGVHYRLIRFVHRS